jgi:hypothetical protein
VRAYPSLLCYDHHTLQRKLGILHRCMEQV